MMLGKRLPRHYWPKKCTLCHRSNGKGMSGFTEKHWQDDSNMQKKKCLVRSHCVETGMKALPESNFFPVRSYEDAKKKLPLRSEIELGLNPEIFSFCNQTTFIMRCDFFFHEIHETKWLECFFAHSFFYLLAFVRCFAQTTPLGIGFVAFGDDDGINTHTQQLTALLGEKPSGKASTDSMNFPSLQRTSETNRWESDATTIETSV
jgi:hypothetical protein